MYDAIQNFFVPSSAEKREELIQSHDRIPGEDILSIASQVANAIDFAHSKGIIHRDVKPSNIFLESDAHGRVALGDFGIAKILGAVQRNITAAGGFSGTPDYLAPEILSTNEITMSADIYSFGVVIFEMICGKTPFYDVSDVHAILVAKIQKNAPSLKSFRRVGNELASRISRTLSRDPQERPLTAREVLSGVEKYILRL